MLDEILKRRAAISERYVESTRHTIQVDWIPYMDEIAEQVGCKPDLGKSNQYVFVNLMPLHVIRVIGSLHYWLRLHYKNLKVTQVLF